MRAAHLYLLLLLALLHTGLPQEFGEFQQLLQMTVGAKVSSMLATTCCVIRQQRCSTPQRTSPTNTTLDLPAVLKRYPGAYLPSDASGHTFDFTFVTPADMKRYSCMYSGTRDLVCRLRDVMQSGWMGWGLSNMGRGGLMALGGMGEEMQEMMEQMMEAGVPPRASNQVCSRCAPLVCAGELAAYTSRSYYPRALDTQGAQRSRFHNCLRRHNLLPPQQTTASPTKSDNATTPVLPDVITQPTAKSTTLSTAPPTTTDNTTSNLPVTHTEVPALTTVLPLTTTTHWAVPWLAATTSSRTSTTVPPIWTTSRLQPTTTWEEIIRYLVDMTKTSTTTANVGNDAVSVPGPPLAPDVRSTSASPRFIPPPGSTELADIGRAGPEGGVETGTVMIVALTVAGIILSCIFLFFLLWRRRRKQREKMKDIGASVSATQVMSEISASLRLNKNKSLPSFSSQRHVIDDSSDEEDEKEGYGVKKEAEDSEKDEDDERYTPVKTTASGGSAGHVSPLRDGDEENNTYASLDETSMLTSCRLQTSAADVTSASTLSSQQSTEGCGAYLSMNGVNRKLPPSKEKTSDESEIKYSNTGNGLPTSSPEGEIYLAMAGQKLGSDDAGYTKMDEPIVLSKKTRNNQKVPQLHQYFNLAAKGVNRAQMALPQPVASPNEQQEQTGAHPPVTCDTAIYSEPYLVPATAFWSKHKGARLTGHSGGAVQGLGGGAVQGHSGGVVQGHSGGAVQGHSGGVVQEGSKTNSSDKSSESTKGREVKASAKILSGRDPKISTDGSRSSPQRSHRRDLPTSSPDSDGYLMPAPRSSSQQL